MKKKKIGGGYGGVCPKQVLFILFKFHSKYFVSFSSSFYYLLQDNYHISRRARDITNDVISLVVLTFI